MTDLPDPDRDLLASAVVDGVADADERAAAEADEAVRARVAEFRGVRAALGEVPAPEPAVREAAIFAALAVFDASQAGWDAEAGDDGADTVAPIPPASRRTGSRWWLGVAAAAVVAAALGVVASNARRGDDESVAIESAATVMDAGAATDQTAPADTIAGSAETADELMTAEAPATDDADAATEAAPAAGDTAESTAASPGTEPAVIVGPDELAAFASAQRGTSTDEITACPEAEIDEVVAVARYAPGAGEPAVDVVVGLDAGSVVALDAVTCAVVATVPAD